MESPDDFIATIGVSRASAGAAYKQRPENVERARALICRYLDNDGVANLDTVYSDPEQIGDLEMYEAAEQLLAEGVIVGPSVADCQTHDEMVYRYA